MAHVRIAEVGRVQLLAAVTYRVVDTFPHHLVVVFHAADQVRLVVCDHVDTPFAFEGDLRFALLAALGGYHNHTVGTARTPQGGRSGILQNRDRLHVFRVHRREDVLAVPVSISIRHTVHNDQGVRIALAGGTDTADTDTHIQTRLTVDRRYLDTRDGSLQCIGQRRVRLRADQLRVDRTDGARQVFFLNRTESLYYNLVQCRGIVFEGDVNGGTTTCGNRHGLRAQEGVFDLAPLVGFDGVVTVKARRSTYGGTHHFHAGADDRLPVTALHHAGVSPLLRLNQRHA